jgi:transcriptional regulator with XRE-family HTH domain
VNESQDLSFGDYLRELRKAKGLSQKELAERVDINFTYLSKIETGSAAPPAEDTIRKLADVLRADVDKLTFLAGKVPKDLGEVLTGSRSMPTLLRAMKDKEFTEEELEKCLLQLRKKGPETK